MMESQKDNVSIPSGCLSDYELDAYWLFSESSGTRAMLSVLIVLTEGSAVAPFIYALF